MLYTEMYWIIMVHATSVHYVICLNLYDNYIICNIYIQTKKTKQIKCTMIYTEIYLIIMLYATSVYHIIY